MIVYLYTDYKNFNRDLPESFQHGSFTLFNEHAHPTADDNRSVEYEECNFYESIDPQMQDNQDIDTSPCPAYQPVPRVK